MLKINKQRKLVFNNYSYQVTLPKIWVDSQDLEKGSLVSFEINDDALIIRAGGKVDGDTERKESQNMLD